MICRNDPIHTTDPHGVPSGDCDLPLGPVETLLLDPAGDDGDDVFDLNSINILVNVP